MRPTRRKTIDVSGWGIVNEAGIRSPRNGQAALNFRPAGADVNDHSFVRPD